MHNWLVDFVWVQLYKIRKISVTLLVTYGYSFNASLVRLINITPGFE